MAIINGTNTGDNADSIPAHVQLQAVGFIGLGRNAKLYGKQAMATAAW